MSPQPTRKAVQIRDLYIEIREVASAHEQHRHLDRMQIATALLILAVELVSDTDMPVPAFEQWIGRLLTTERQIVRDPRDGTDAAPLDEIVPCPSCGGSVELFTLSPDSTGAPLTLACPKCHEKKPRRATT